jgi:hypothetical protein
MNSKSFLQIGGVVLVLVALLGFFGVIGPTADKSIFGSAWFFDTAENWAHLVLGVIALLAVFATPLSVQKPLVILVGVIALLAGLYSLFGPVTEGNVLLGAELQNPTDTILHLVIAIWAFWSAKNTTTA